MARLWLFTLRDLMHSLIEQHLHKQTFLSKSQTIKLSGWAFILASFGFIAILNEAITISRGALVVSSILLAIGMLGLRAGYGDRIGGFGRAMLLLGVLGLALVLVGVGVLNRLQPMIQIGNARIETWFLFYFGPAIGLLGLALYGLAALRRKPMAGLNWLPLATGVWYPAIYSFFFVYYAAHVADWHSIEPIFWVVILTMVIQFASLCLFGFVLSAGTREEMATA
jgi:hypothetical protein